MKILARHKWLVGCTITESYDPAKQTTERGHRRFTATIRGWRGFVIYEGFCREGLGEAVRNKVEEIRDRIDKGDETVFAESCRLE